MTTGEDVEMSLGNNRTINRTRPVEGTKVVCRNCSGLSTEDSLATLDARYLCEVQWQARLPSACFSCQRSLSEHGVRWWVDPATGRECEWYGHPGWA
jgi:hypothetical protein